MAASVATGVSLNHISRESSDIRRLANFYKEVSQGSQKKKKLCFNYQIFFFFFWFLKFDYVFVQIFGFEEIESPNFLEFKVIWLNLSSAFQLHLIERNPSNNLPEGPWSATSPVLDPSHLPRGHHICFTVSNLDSFLQSLKVKYSFLFFFFFLLFLPFTYLGYCC